jgi:hypothetical protein
MSYGNYLLVVAGGYYCAVVVVDALVGVDVGVVVPGAVGVGVVAAALVDRACGRRPPEMRMKMQMKVRWKG